MVPIFTAVVMFHCELSSHPPITQQRLAQMDRDATIENYLADYARVVSLTLCSLFDPNPIAL